MERRHLANDNGAMSFDDEPRACGGGPTTTPLEVKEMPPALSKTLENIVGQLDVLTQVSVMVELFLGGENTGMGEGGGSQDP